MSTDPTAGGADPGFDPGGPRTAAARRSRCAPPSRSGALVYHFGTRKLSFLKTPQLVDVVTGLEKHADVHAAIDAAGVAETERPPAYLKALAGLAASGTIEARTTT